MRKVVVTGGAGFIGSHLVDRLLGEGDDVTVVDDFSTGSLSNLNDAVRRGARVVAADVASTAGRRAVVAAEPEVLVLLAAQSSVVVSMRDPVLDATTNLVGLVNMLEAARECGAKRVVFASSGGTIYGEVSPERLPIRESEPLGARSFYGLSKQTAGSYLDIYRAVHGLEYVALALGNVYGSRQSPDGEAGVVAIFAKRLLAGRACRVNGDGATTRDYVHVSDVARAFALATRRGQGLVNVGTGVETSVLEVHRTLCRAANLEQVPEHGPALLGEVRRVGLCASRAREQLGWEPSVPFAEGIREVLAWMYTRERDVEESGVKR